MRMALTAVGILAALQPAWAAGLTIIPISPAPGEILPVGESAAVSLRTTPGAVCYADIHVAGAAAPVHKSAARAGDDGLVTWLPDNVNSSGKREVTAHCSLNGEHAEKHWTFSVE
jgi:hypothetical protein